MTDEHAMGVHRNVYNWLSRSVLGGSRTPAQVKHYVENSVLGSTVRYNELCDMAAAAKRGAGGVLPAAASVVDNKTSADLGSDVSSDDDEAASGSDLDHGTDSSGDEL